jgi:hypothetical protein
MYRSKLSLSTARYLVLHHGETECRSEGLAQIHVQVFDGKNVDVFNLLLYYSSHYQTMQKKQRDILQR